MNRWVEISFDCLPLRMVGRLDVPMDASPKYQAFCERIKSAIAKHGSHNTFYLYSGKCIYRLANHEQVGWIEFKFEGVALTDPSDEKTETCDLQVELVRETCDWLTETAVTWFAKTVPHTVKVEFDRYINAGDLQQAKERIEKIQSASDKAGGFVGMYL